MDETQWWKDFYLPETGLFFFGRDLAEIEETSHFLKRALRLQPGDLLFDQCSGNGSISLPLAAEGIRVFGVDWVQHYVDQANAGSSEFDDAVFVQGDAFKVVPPRPCKAAINWHSSFGYGGTENHNLGMLQRAYQALEPGGLFALDYQNVPGLFHGFKESLVRRTTSDGHEILLVRESSLDFDRGRINQTWTYLLQHERKVRQSSLALLLPHQIKGMLEACGFESIDLYGDTLGSPLSLQSPRCILVGQKPYEN